MNRYRELLEKVNNTLRSFLYCKDKDFLLACNLIKVIEEELAKPELLSDDMQDLVSKAMVKSYQLGQLYWQQADSESIRQQNKSIETKAIFENLIEDTINSIGIGN